ncbi:MAG: HIT family protein [Pseudomonadota bacterium]
MSGPDLSAEACVFCRILAGEEPVSAFYEDDICLGLMTIGPVNAGHAMVIPRRHAPYLADLPAEEWGHVARIGQRTAAAIRTSGLQCTGVNLFVADGESAEQEVFHLHLHIVPRFEGDGFGFRYDERHFRQPPRAELDRVATLLRDRIG